MIKSEPRKNTAQVWLIQTIVGCTFCLLVGGFSGYFIGQKNVADDQKAAGSATTSGIDRSQSEIEQMGLMTLTDVVGGYHRVYSADSAPMVEFPSSEPQRVEALFYETQIDSSIPDLSRQGLQFKGARLLAASGQSMVTLFYQTVKRETLLVGYFNLNLHEPAKNIILPPVEKWDATVTYLTRDGIGIYIAASNTIPDLDAVIGKVRAL
jgi:hypothetical protein